MDWPVVLGAFALGNVLGYVAGLRKGRRRGGYQPRPARRGPIVPPPPPRTQVRRRGAPLVIIAPGGVYRREVHPQDA